MSCTSFLCRRERPKNRRHRTLWHVYRQTLCRNTFGTAQRLRSAAAVLHHDCMAYLQVGSNIHKREAPEAHAVLGHMHPTKVVLFSSCARTMTECKTPNNLRCCPHTGTWCTNGSFLCCVSGWMASRRRWRKEVRFRVHRKQLC